jgi:DnaJ homolog subfamily C member 28
MVLNAGIRNLTRLSLSLSTPVYLPSIPGRLTVQSLRGQLSRYSVDSGPGSDDKHLASSKLFADAEREEAEDDSALSSPRKSSKLTALEQQNENWTGDESIQDAVLRMLVDKYKPMRTGTIVTAEEKIRKAPPKIREGISPVSTISDGEVGSRVVERVVEEESFAEIMRRIDVEASSATTLPSSSSIMTADASAQTFQQPMSGSWATESLLPSSETHRPWHTEYKVPTHVTSSIKFGRMPPPAQSRQRQLLSEDELGQKRRDRAAMRREEQAGRLTRAREGMLDYRIGLRKGQELHAHREGGGGGITAGAGRLNPVTMKGWAGLVEDRIEVCCFCSWTELNTHVSIRELV